MFTPSTEPVHVAVVGGGAAGLMAAGAALEAGARVTVFEHTDRLGKKLRITGKGRCNVTNHCSVAEVVANVLHNPRFLYTALSHLTPEDTMALFEGLGVPLKTERGRRVFPVSDRAQDIVEALKQYAAGARVRHAHVRGLTVEDGRVTGVVTDRAEAFDAVVLATGGRSYPLTGSDGSGYRLAQMAGHTCTPLSPSLVPLTSPDSVCRELMGLSLRNVELRILRRDGKCLYRDFGELLFTHFGLSGPMVLSASSHLHGEELAALQAVIDLKPALDEGTLDARLLSDFRKYANRNFANALSDLLPAKLIPVLVARSGIDPEKKVHTVTKEERRRLLQLLKGFALPLSGFRPIEEAIVTAGGISVAEVDPKTMASKRAAGLYLCGEMLDVDAYTGGYNLQIAFSTGHLAGTYAAYEDKQHQGG